MTKISYTITNESISVFYEGQMHTVQNGTPNFKGLQQAIINDDFDSIPKFLTVAKTVESWAQGDFKVEGEKVLYQGEELPSELNARILAMAAQGSDPKGLLKFWERLQLNPSMRSVEQLYTFLVHEGIPITDDGYFLAYKGVRHDYKDVHSGTIDNSPGSEPFMARNKISDDPRQPCHQGLHVGALRYAKSFGPTVVICQVDPADVVCVPYDSSAEKMRVCRYKVIGNYGSKLDNVSIDAADLPQVDAKTPKASKAAKGKPVSTSKFAIMSEADLMEQHLDALRSYAANELKIVGASKIPGGRLMLVKRIIEVRGEA